MSESDISPAWPRRLITFGYLWSFSFIPYGILLNWQDKASRVTYIMVFSQVIIWTVIIGAVQWKFKDDLKKRMDQYTWVKKHQYLTFFLFSSLMALIEELIATIITNLATPVFGVSPTDAYITSSTNFWVVITNYSVFMFIPFILAWGEILRFVKFDATWVYVLFGITGALTQAIFNGVGNLINIGYWINIYGLMVFLPAYLYHYEEDTKPAPNWMYPLAIVLQFFALLLAYLLIFVSGILANLILGV